MEYSGKNKRAGELLAGDCVTLTEFAADAAEVEEIQPIGALVVVRLANGTARPLPPEKWVRLYK